MNNSLEYPNLSITYSEENTPKIRGDLVIHSIEVEPKTSKDKSSKDKRSDVIVKPKTSKDKRSKSDSDSIFDELDKLPDPDSLYLKIKPENKATIQTRILPISKKRLKSKDKTRTDIISEYEKLSHRELMKAQDKILKRLKELYPDKTVWSWTGFLFDRDLKDKEVMKYLDVLVDGQFVEELHNPKLNWRGSENQRVIDVQKSLKTGNVELFCE